MTVILTSDFPATAHPRIVEQLQSAGDRPRIAWIGPDSDAGQAQFADAQRRFGALGFESLEYCDIDMQKDEVQLAYLYEFDIVYLADGDSLRFRYNMLRAGLSGRLRQCAAAGRIIVAAGGGALLLTPNVSLWRLRTEPLEDVLASRSRYDGMGAVAYEVLPHADSCDAAFLELVRRYSERIENDIVALNDGAALFASTPHHFDYVGEITRYRDGVAEPYGPSRSGG